MLENHKGKRIIFVGGSPRSGTTLVQNILDSHPMIAGGPEFDRIPDIIDLRNKFHESINIGRIDVFVTHEEIDGNICLLIENLLYPFAASHNKQFVSEKTPSNILVFSELSKICPDARFIFVVRDPRAVISSMLYVGKRAKEKKIAAPYFTTGLIAAVAYVKKCLKSGFEFMEASNGRALLVVYENLVEEPEKNTKMICDFLGIDWHSDTISPGERMHKGAKGIDGVWYDKKMYNRNIEKTDVGKWKSTLSAYQIMRINNEFKGWGSLERLGYDFHQSELSFFKRIIGGIYLGIARLINKTFVGLLKGIVGIRPLYAILRYLSQMAKRPSKNHA